MNCVKNLDLSETSMSLADRSTADLIEQTDIGFFVEPYDPAQGGPFSPMEGFHYMKGKEWSWEGLADFLFKIADNPFLRPLEFEYKVANQTFYFQIRR